MYDITHVRLDNSDRRVIVYSYDDVEGILDHNKQLRTQTQKSDWGRHVASIPNVISLKWLNEEFERGHEVRYLSEEWDLLVERKLKDPEWAYLRVDAPEHRIGWK
jgi:hypothetical protein